MAKKPLPPQKLLRQLLDYNRETGELKWRERRADMFKPGRWGALHCANSFNAQYAGKKADAKVNNGYNRIRILGKVYASHRIIWKLVHGRDPDCIDHQNGLRTDNRIENLRDVSLSQNSRNRKSPSSNSTGQLGVVWHQRDKRWMATIKHDGRKIHLGYFKEFQAAVEARKKAEVQFGYHRNHGR